MRLIHYQDLEIHEATDTVDKDAPCDNGPATLEDIFAVHQTHRNIPRPNHRPTRPTKRDEGSN